MLAPLVHLVDEVEPDPDLFARIEAQLDADPPPPLPRSRPLRRRWIAAVLCAAGVAGGLGALAYFGADRQQIVARPADDAAWVPLGAVTLHGPALRAFVRGKCDGHTHFFITMHGVRAAPDGQIPHTGQALSAPQEKILMECIF